MNDIQVFKNEEFGDVRTVELNNEPWFVGKDVAKILKYENQNRDIIRHVDEDDRVLLNEETQYRFGTEFDYKTLGQRGGWLINESGFYSLVLSSKMPKAKEFKRWVTSEVIPCIRKHGAYMTPETIEQAITNPDFIIRLATELKKEQEKSKALEAKNNELEIDNQLLSRETLVWTNRQNINAIMRKLAGTLNISFNYCWGYLYKELLYRFNISLKGRAAADKSKKKKKILLDYIHEDEWDKVEATIAAICSARGINPKEFFSEALNQNLKVAN